MKSPFRLNLFRILAVAGLLSALAVFANRAGAQTFLAPWDTPTNLSQSSATSNPRMVIDPAGRIDVIWEDTFVEGIVHTSWDGQSWSTPAPITPFFDVSLDSFKMLADSSGAVHMLWLGDNSELFYSRAPAGAFSQPSLWSALLQISPAVVSYDVAISSEDDLQVTYIHTGGVFVAQDAGVYHTRKLASSSLWTLPSTLDESPYYRDADASFRVQVATGQGGQVYSAWGNNAQALIKFVNSFDFGASWAPAQIMDSRAEADDPQSINPADVLMAALDERVLLAWKAGHFGSLCEGYYKSSLDGGVTWSEISQMPADFRGCWDTATMFARGSESLFIIAETDLGAQMIAWDGASWGEPAFQLVLSYFPHPVTFQSVDLECLEDALDPNGRLYVVGCEVTGTRDIWITSRDLDPLADWYPDPPPPSVWTRQIDIPIEDVPTNIELSADSTGILHTVIGFPNRPAVFYGRWEGATIESGVWSNLVGVLNSSSGRTGRPSLAIGPGNELLIATSSGDAGEITFGSTSQLQGLITTDWTDPMPVPAQRPAGSAPDLALGPGGTLYLTYAITVNENRGIYLAKSSDLGLTWSEPVLAFDAVASDWMIVDFPKLATTTDGSLHLLWTRSELDPVQGNVLVSSGLYYAVSTDDGLTWSGAEELSRGAIELAAIVGLADGQLHRVWQERVADTATIWHDSSADDGLTWSSLERVSSSTDEYGQFALITDPAGQVHLFELNNTNIEGEVDQVLQHRIWQGSSWSTESRSVVTADVSYAMAAAMDVNGRLSVLFAGQALLQDSDAFGPLMLTHLQRNYVLPEVVATEPVEAPTSTEAPPTATAEATPAADLATPTPQFPLGPADTGAPPADNSLTGLLLGFGAAVLLILVIVLVANRINKQRGG